MSDMRDDIRKIKVGIDKLNCCNAEEAPLDIQPIVDELVDNNAKTDISNTELGIINNSLDTVNTQLSEIDVDIEAIGTVVTNILGDQQPQQKLKLRGFTVGSFATKTLTQLAQTAYPGLDITKVRSVRIQVPISTTSSVSIDSGATNMKLVAGTIYTFEGTYRDTILTDLGNIVFANSGAGTEEITIWFEMY